METTGIPKISMAKLKCFWPFFAIFLSKNWIDSCKTYCKGLESAAVSRKQFLTHVCQVSTKSIQNWLLQRNSSLWIANLMIFNKSTYDPCSLMDSRAKTFALSMHFTIQSHSYQNIYLQYLMLNCGENCGANYFPQVSNQYNKLTSLKIWSAFLSFRGRQLTFSSVDIVLIMNNW